jgi:hypothetical protein
MGFLTTIQNMIDVAKLNAYLLLSATFRQRAGDTHHVKMYCV